MPPVTPVHRVKAISLKTGARFPRASPHLPGRRDTPTLGRRRLRALQGVNEVAFRRRLGDYLRRRGFSPEVVRTTVERLWREREE